MDARAALGLGQREPGDVAAAPGHLPRRLAAGLELRRGPAGHRLESGAADRSRHRSPSPSLRADRPAPSRGDMARRLPAARAGVAGPGGERRAGADAARRHQGPSRARTADLVARDSREDLSTSGHDRLQHGLARPCPRAGGASGADGIGLAQLAGPGRAEPLAIGDTGRPRGSTGCWTTTRSIVGRWATGAPAAPF